jgi:hypothetical protein
VKSSERKQEKNLARLLVALADWHREAGLAADAEALGELARLFDSHRSVGDDRILATIERLGRKRRSMLSEPSES